MYYIVHMQRDEFDIIQNTTKLWCLFIVIPKNSLVKSQQFIKIYEQIVKTYKKILII